jgi:hypothetical protein
MSQSNMFNNFVNQMDGTRRKKFNDPAACQIPLIIKGNGRA